MVCEILNQVFNKNTFWYYFKITFILEIYLKISNYAKIP